MKNKIAKLINDEVDWSEWAKDDSEGEKIADKIIEEFISIIESSFVGEELLYGEWLELKEKLKNE